MEEVLNGDASCADSLTQQRKHELGPNLQLSVMCLGDGRRYIHQPVLGGKAKMRRRQHNRNLQLRAPFINVPEI